MYCSVESLGLGSMVVGDFGAPLEMTVQHVPVRSLPADWYL